MNLYLILGQVVWLYTTYQLQLGYLMLKFVWGHPVKTNNSVLMVSQTHLANHYPMLWQCLILENNYIIRVCRERIQPFELVVLKNWLWYNLVIKSLEMLLSMHKYTLLWGYSVRMRLFCEIVNWVIVTFTRSSKRVIQADLPGLPTRSF